MLITYPNGAFRSTVSLLRDRLVVHERAALMAWTAAKKGDPTGRLTLAHMAHDETTRLLREAIEAIEQEARAD